MNEENDNISFSEYNHIKKEEEKVRRSGRAKIPSQLYNDHIQDFQKKKDNNDDQNAYEDYKLYVYSENFEFVQSNGQTGTIQLVYRNHTQEAIKNSQRQKNKTKMYKKQRSNYINNNKGSLKNEDSLDFFSMVYSAAKNVQEEGNIKQKKLFPRDDFRTDILLNPAKKKIKSLVPNKYYIKKVEKIGSNQLIFDHTFFKQVQFEFDQKPKIKKNQDSIKHLKELNLKQQFKSFTKQLDISILI